MKLRIAVIRVLIFCFATFFVTGKVVAQEKQEQTERAFRGLPKGMVAAFDLADCPRGWEKFEQASGRTIIGVGTGKGNKPGDPPLTTRTLRQRDGHEMVTLTIGQMPRHTHTYESHAAFGADGINGAAQISAPTRHTGPKGDNKPHNNIPPFVALTYCKKR